MWNLYRFLKPYWKAAVAAPLLMLIEVFADLLQPRLMGSIIDEGVLTGDLGHVQRTGALMLGIALIGLLGGVGCTVFSSTASQNFGADIRKTLFRKVQTLSFGNLDRFQAGTLVTRLTNDVVQVQNFVQMTMRVLVRAPFLSLGSLIMAFTLDAKLSLLLLVSMPLLALCLTVIIRKGFPLFAKVQQKLDGVNTVLQENLAGIRVVKAFVRSGYERKRFGNISQGHRDIAIRATRTMALMTPVLMLIMNVTVVAVLWFGGNRVWTGSMPVGDLVAFLNYVTQMLSSLMMVSMMLMFVSRAKASADRINEVLDASPEIESGRGAAGRDPHTLTGDILFDNVSFAYGSGKPVLTDLRFRASAGQTVGIIGSTGSGKTSLVQLIPRLYDVTSGRVLVDGVDVREYELDRLRSRIGIVLQQAILFTGSIRDNIAFGRPDATQEEIEAAARAAQAHAFIQELPEGYDTQLGQRGINLSGGQKQRLSIARALLLDPAILILDDSTSAVDMGTEAKILEALRERRHGGTTLLIAQRISSVFEADWILVLEDGRLVDQGTHRDLLASSAVYQDIYRSQLGEEEKVYG
ncbi:ABC transporter [Paenibacillus sp. J31TS4]|uniref:ABC transporter ATP-binding protein n=1 Tax=Paenibacillus sp. J31TS4 TaxID=2807195 RepID=UPI001B0892E4|nr:ABC transporter ATP-binding protein [Paenibacillus sp. J31TS4]GIP40416.1 ABC transporter [Paenibacillus sp. J31TS4]